MKHKFAIFYLLAFIGLFMIMFTTSLIAKFSPQQITTFKGQVQQVASTSTVLSIFAHNYLICLLSLVPMFSVGYTPSIMYATGIAFARLGANPTQFLTNPFTYIEIAAIGYAFVTSIFTIIGLYKRQYRQTARLLVRAIGVSAIILFISATLEIIDIHGTVILSFLNVIPEWAQILLTVDILFLFPRYYKQYIENKVKKHWKLR